MANKYKYEVHEAGHFLIPVGTYQPRLTYGFICVVLLINFITVNLSENLKIKECILLFNVIFFSGRVVCKDKSIVYHSPNPYLMCKLKLLFKNINNINLVCLFVYYVTY